MRRYNNFEEAYSENQRELKEMGIRVHTQTFQDKNISDLADEYDTMEIRDHAYSVINPMVRDLEPTQPWADAEWAERLSGINGKLVNPGSAWRVRKDEYMDWLEFIEIDSKPMPMGMDRDEWSKQVLKAGNRARFAYTYSQRFAISYQVQHLINRLKEDPFTRQGWISIWLTTIDPDRIGRRRVPCTLGYQFMFRDGRLHIHYKMRSCDFDTHFENDIWMAMKLLEYVSKQTHLPMGSFTHSMDSFHSYLKNLEGVF